MTSLRPNTFREDELIKLLRRMQQKLRAKHWYSADKWAEDIDVGLGHVSQLEKNKLEERTMHSHSFKKKTEDYALGDLMIAGEPSTFKKGKRKKEEIVILPEDNPGTLSWIHKQWCIKNKINF